ncbi:hypothetical protein ACN38_g12702, partial [Penicillium nordicum]
MEFLGMLVRKMKFLGLKRIVTRILCSMYNSVQIQFRFSSDTVQIQFRFSSDS